MKSTCIRLPRSNPLVCSLTWSSIWTVNKSKHTRLTTFSNSIMRPKKKWFLNKRHRFNYRLRTRYLLDSKLSWTNRIILMTCIRCLLTMRRWVGPNNRFRTEETPRSTKTMPSTLAILLKWAIDYSKITSRLSRMLEAPLWLESSSKTLEHQWSKWLLILNSKISTIND